MASALAGLLLITACGGSGESEESSPTAGAPTPFISTASPAPLAFQYEVQEGDSVYGLAVRFDTTAEEIVALNNMSSPDELTIGDIILIPGEPPPGLPSPSVIPQPPESGVVPVAAGRPGLPFG